MACSPASRTRRGADLRDVEAFVGTSAGSIVAARLAAGRRPRAARRGASATPSADGRADELTPPACAPRRGAARVGWAVSAPLAAAGHRATGARRRARARGRARARRRPRPHARTTCARASSAGARASTGACGSAASTAAAGTRVVFGAPGAPTRQRRRGGPRLVRDPVGLRPGADRRPRVRRRRRVERDEPRRRARRPRHRGAVPRPDRVAGGRRPRMAALRGAFRVAIALELRDLRRARRPSRHVGPTTQAADGDGHRPHGPSRRRALRRHRQGRAPG